MTLILASRPNVYSSSPLDRIGRQARGRRLDRGRSCTTQTRCSCRSGATATWCAAWTRARRRRCSSPARWAARCTCRAGPGRSLACMTNARCSRWISARRKIRCRCCRRRWAQFVDLRSVGWGVPRAEASVLAHARGLMHWRARHRFCGVCGGVCDARSAGHVMVLHRLRGAAFPAHRSRGDHAGDARRPGAARPLAALPARQHVFDAGRLRGAGRDAGRSGAARGVRRVRHPVGDVQYHSSQPWPFPGNIMLGFYGEGLSEDITIDPEEMLDVRWFSREQIAQSRGARVPAAARGQHRAAADRGLDGGRADNAPRVVAAARADRPARRADSSPEAECAAAGRAAIPTVRSIYRGDSAATTRRSGRGAINLMWADEAVDRQVHAGEGAGAAGRRRGDPAAGLLSDGRTAAHHWL